MAVSEIFFISTSVSTARSRSVRRFEVSASGGTHGCAAANSRSRTMPAGSPLINNASPASTTSSPPTSVSQRLPRCIATTRIPTTTGNSISERGRFARWLPSATTSRCETSAASARSTTKARGIPMFLKTILPMSTAAFAICSIEDTTCRTELIPSTSRG